MPRTAACARITTLSKPRSRFDGRPRKFPRRFPIGPADRSALMQVIAMRTLGGARGVSPCTRCVTCEATSHSPLWRSCASERAPFRPRSVFRTATTPTTTARSTSPMSRPACSVTRFAGRGEIALRTLSTPLPAFAGGGSRCDFRGQRQSVRRRELLEHDPGKDHAPTIS